MAGVERGGIFAFIVLTIALSVTVTLGLALMFFKPDADLLEKTLKENHDLIRNQNLLLERNAQLESALKGHENPKLPQKDENERGND